MDLDQKIYVAGHTGMVGSAIVRMLEKKGYNNIIKRTSAQLDLREQSKVNEFFREEKPETVILAAAKVGGIEANMNDLTGFLLENIQIQTNVLTSAYNNNVQNLMLLGSSCIYPRESAQPIKEDYLLTGPLEPTNEGYALAKITGLKACEYYNKEHGMNYISVIPTNLYGINDNFDPKTSHVISSIMRRMHIAKENKDPYVEIWGTGKPYREFMYVDDMAEATIFILENYKGSSSINIGTGKDITIKELAKTIQETIGYKGKLIFNTSKPDGMFRKRLDVTKLKDMGWESKISLKDGLQMTYKWYLENNDEIE
ncbi:MAG: GDP-fucose synthetase [Methanobacteriales archaeon HGW-Methanobacteriales-1]|jgi:GDP-L-fucose synthase|nr:MAG: GDP-fucose synthetase [Methanobacteriales archaeon HGW-Methanobacteriales-1]